MTSLLTNYDIDTLPTYVRHFYIRFTVGIGTKFTCLTYLKYHYHEFFCSVFLCASLCLYLRR